MKRLIVNFTLILLYSIRDLNRLIFNSGILRINRKNIEGHIIAVNHTIEKGLAMPDRKVPFSVDKVEYLIFLLKKFDLDFKINKNLKNVFEISIRILQDWSEIHKNFESSEIKDLISEILKFKSSLESNTTIDFNSIRSGYIPNDTFSNNLDI